MDPAQTPSGVSLRLAKWFFFTVLISLAPIALDYVVLIAREDTKPHSITEVLSHGELYLLSSAFICVGLGEVIDSGKKRRTVKVVVSGLATIILVFAIGLYVATKNISENMGTFFAAPSIWFFVASCVIATSCLALGGEGDA